MRDTHAQILLTCNAVVIHFADKYAKSMFRASADTETQTSIRTLIYCHCVNVFTVIPSYIHTKHTDMYLL